MNSSVFFSPSEEVNVFYRSSRKPEYRGSYEPLYSTTEVPKKISDVATMVDGNDLGM